MFEERKPFPEGFRQKASKLNLFDFAYYDLRLNGSNLTAEGVWRIVNGGMVPGASVQDHAAVSRYRALLELFADMIGMKISLDERQLTRVYATLSDEPEPKYRIGTPILYHLDYTPPLPEDIRDLMRAIFRSLSEDPAMLGKYGAHSDSKNAIRRAALMHDRIICVYPYDRCSEGLARAALQFELISAGFPIAPLDIPETEYNNRIAKALRSGDEGALEEIIIAGLDKKYDNLLKLLD
jgi:hypothetical protein